MGADGQLPPKLLGSLARQQPDLFMGQSIATRGVQCRKVPPKLGGLYIQRDFRTHAPGVFDQVGQVMDGP